MNDAAETYLDYFLSAPETTSAVLLEGPWGSGKTYFLRRYLDKRAADERAVDELNAKTPSYLYVSLNGVRATGEITAQFFAQANPLLAGKAAGFLGMAIGRVANGLSGGAAINPEKDAAFLQSFLLNLNGKVLVFDDLERCQMPLQEVLGFINNYVEHDRRKVILLAAENEITGDAAVEYRRRKEKLVGKTLRVGSEPDAVYDLFVTQMRNPQAQKTALAERAEALRTFEASEIQNFRSLRAVLDDFDRLIGLVDPALCKSDAAMSRLLVMMIALGMEHRAGTLNTDEVASFISGIRSQLYSSLSQLPLSGHEQKISAIAAKYNNVSWADPVVPFSSLAALFASGALDVEEVNAHLRNHPLIADPAKLPAWRLLWSWTDLSATDYQAARQDLLNDLAARRYTEAEVILHVAGVVRELTAAKDPILGRRDIARYFASYVKELVRSGKLQSGRAMFDFDPTGAFGLGFKTNGQPGFEVIKGDVRRGVEKAISAKMKTEALALLAYLSTGRDSYPALYEYGYGPDVFGAVAVLACMPIKDFAALMVVDGRLNDRLFSSLVERYERGPGQALMVEEAWAKALRTQLDKVAKSAAQPQRHLLDARIRYYFTKIDAAFATMKSRP
ncbi:P-loop NTPase fold protein [Brevundimonas aurantiaca]|uniref:P-loop NTPase fold protein n=1 Tax=Brevundimonas aurantiaca TaxID=74316 RepID=UPI0030195EED